MITENQECSTNQHLIDYGKVMDEAVEKLQMLMEENKVLPIKWLTLQLFEGNLYVKNYLSGFIDREVLTSYIHEIEVKVIENEGVQSTQQFIYQQRREFIDDLLEKVILTSNPYKVPLSEKIGQDCNKSYIRNTYILINNVFDVYVNV